MTEEALSAEKQSNITRSLCNNGFCRDYNPEKLVEYKKECKTWKILIKL